MPESNAERGFVAKSAWALGIIAKILLGADKPQKGL
jgi:hypothetical protein